MKRLVIKITALEVVPASLRQMQAIELEEFKLGQRNQELTSKTKMDITKVEEIVYVIEEDCLHTTPPNSTPELLLNCQS